MAYIPPLNGGRLNASISGNSTSAGAGYSLLSTGTMYLAGGNNVTLSQNGASITISGANAPSGSINFSASNTSANLASVTFSNSNGLSFGLNAGVITASHNALTSQSNQDLAITASGNTAGQSSVSTINASALKFGATGTGVSVGLSNGSVLISASQSVQTQNNIAGIAAAGGTATSGTVSFANGGGIGFGMNGQTMTASHNGITSQSNPGVSAGGASYSFQTLLFSNTNGISFSTSVSNGSSAVVGSVATTYAASNHSHGNPTLNLTNLSGTTASASNGLTLSLSAAAPGGGVALSAAGQSASNGTVTLSNSNGLAFGMAGSVITGSYTVPTQSNQTLSVALTGNTGGNTSGASFDARNITIQGLGNAIAGISTSAGGGSSLMISASQSAQTQSNIQALYDGANTVATGSVSLGNINGVTLGLNGQTLTASHNGITSQSNQLMTLQANTTNTIAGYSTSGTVNASALNLRGTGNVSVGYSAGSVFISGAGGGGGGGSISAGGTNYTAGVSFSPAGALTMSTAAGSTLTMSVPAVSQLTYTGAVSMSSNGSTVSIGAPVVSLGMSTTTAGGATGGTSGTVSNGMYLVAGSNITLSQSTGAGGATVSIYGTSGGGGGGGVALYDGAHSISSGTANLNASGALTLSITNQSLNMSVPATSSLSAISPLSISVNASTISLSLNQATYNSTLFGGANGQMLGTASLGQNSIYIFPEMLDNYVTGSVIKIPVLITNSSSATAAQTRGYTANFGVYSRHSTNSTLLTRMYSTSYTAGMSANSNGSWGISIITGVGNSTSYNSLSASSAGINLSASVHGSREFIMPFATNLVPGEYWFALQNSSSSGGTTNNLFNVSHIIGSTVTGNQLGVSQGSQSNGIARNIGYGVYSATSASMPAAISMTQINQTNINPMFYFINTTS